MRRFLRFYFLEATPDNGFLVSLRLWVTLATTAVVVFLFGLARFDGTREFWLFVTISPVVFVASMTFVMANYRKARAFHAARIATDPAPVVENTRSEKSRRSGKL
ncbi:MAG: hypothetical protein FD165_1294 [Gammaproteobacteria bacterium]|nr:MAG: hypothetical protein FD165_1294 [Gammaproteobacteria bacterium]TND05793.1 MAG: hypothetical protein FD120_1006 [Gammaproteobacteria bacterium]